MSDTDIMTLFVKDPLQHTNEDIEKIVAKMREQRHLFNAAPAKKTAAPKGPAPKVDLGSLDLGDL